MDTQCYFMRCIYTESQQNYTSGNSNCSMDKFIHCHQNQESIVIDTWIIPHHADLANYPLLHKDILLHHNTMSCVSVNTLGSLHHQHQT
ncbi:unnamed protein product [Caretta caretta]